MYSLNKIGWNNWNKETELKRNIQPKNIKGGFSMAQNKNALEPLGNSVVGVMDLVSDILVDALGGLDLVIRRIVTGKWCENDPMNKMQIKNEIKYNYIPTTEALKEVSSNNITYKYIEGNKEGIKACVGIDVENNQKVWFDITNSHALVGGASRWGKSNFLNVLITSLMLTYTENELMMLGCDFKKADVYYFRNYKHFKGMYTDKIGFLASVRGLQKEMDKREQILNKYNCRNVIKYNKKYNNKLPIILYIIDELPQLTYDKECREILHLTMAKSASFGIYFVLATQDCTKETVGKCKMNCSQTVAFHTRDKTDSETLANGLMELHEINIKGRCLLDNGAEAKEVQIYYLDEDKIDRLLKDKRK